jgi:hypothetical protein
MKTSRDIRMLFAAVTHPVEGLSLETLLTLKLEKGRAIAQAVSRWLPTAAARVQSRVWSSWICGGQGFLRVLRFHSFQQILHPHNHQGKVQ